MRESEGRGARVDVVSAQRPGYPVLATMAFRVPSPPARGSALLLLLLPVLLLVSSLGGVTAWVHAHGDLGPHLHILPAFPGQAEHGELTDGHATQHLPGQDRHAPQAPEDAPSGLRLEVPDVLARAARTLSQDVSSNLRIQLALRLPDRSGLACAELSRCARDARPAPLRPRDGSGLQAVLRSSHAFLS